MSKKSFFDSLGEAFSWAHGFRKETGALLNIDANRSHLLRRTQEACERDGFQVELVRQPAVLPALEVAVRLGHKRHSAFLERAGDGWERIVDDIAAQLVHSQEATVFLQLEAREARAYVCCTQPRTAESSASASDAGTTRQLTLVDVIDDHNLADAYLEAGERTDR